MRNTLVTKFNRARNPARKPYDIRNADIAFVKYAYGSATGALANPQAGKIYWIQFQASADTATAEINDAFASALNKRLGGKYLAKDSDSYIVFFDPPREFTHGLYATISNMIVEVCYEVIGRMLPCTVTVFYPPGTLNLVCRVTVSYIPGSTNLVCRVNVAYITGTSNLVCRVNVYYIPSSTDLVCRVNVIYIPASTDLVCRVTVYYIPATTDLVCRVNVAYVSGSSNLVCRVAVQQRTGTDLVSRVTVGYAGQVRYLVCRLTVVGINRKNLTCRLTVTLP